MKTMEQMQREMLDRCFTELREDGQYWPKPYIHLCGAMEVCRTPEDLARAMEEDASALYWAGGIVLAAVVACVVWVIVT